MNERYAHKFRRMIEHAATLLTDEDALQSVELFPLWISGHEYRTDDRIQYESVLYKCVQSHTSQDDWTPDMTPALWVVVSIEEWPEWIQPTGAHDAYNNGDKVSHLERHWISIIDANVYEPSIYGWDEV